MPHWGKHYDEGRFGCAKISETIEPLMDCKADLSSVAVVIPAYQPSEQLPGFVSDLVDRGFEHLFVVNDGSDAALRRLFDEVASLPGCTLARHAINLGKGAALKTGINASFCEVNGLRLIVTADADGQHSPDDVKAVAMSGIQNPDHMVLGVRSFGDEVPLRSRLGNLITCQVLRLVVGQKLTDTQTGLRAIPASLAQQLLTSPARGYEFELDMLMEAHSRRIPIQEVPIQTIYLEGNKSSHFNPILDSMRIYFVLLRFGFLSLITALLDNSVFMALFLATGSTLRSQAAARLVSMTFNYLSVKRFAFNAAGQRLSEFLKYAALTLVSGSVSYGLIRALTTKTPLGVLRAKLIAETLLFIVNFSVQRDFIFTHRWKTKPVALSSALSLSAAAASDSSGISSKPIEQHVRRNARSTSLRS